MLPDYNGGGQGRLRDGNAADLASTGDTLTRSFQTLPRLRVTCQHACNQELLATEDLQERSIHSNPIHSSTQLVELIAHHHFNQLYNNRHGIHCLQCSRQLSTTAIS